MSVSMARIAICCNPCSLNRTQEMRTEAFNNLGMTAMNQLDEDPVDFDGGISGQGPFQPFAAHRVAGNDGHNGFGQGGLEVWAIDAAIACGSTGVQGGQYGGSREQTLPNFPTVGQRPIDDDRHR